MVYKLIDGRPMMPPENGVLRDGRAVSGYRNLLCAQAEAAEAEGYYELEETAPPVHDAETENITASYTVENGKIVQKWEVHSIEGGAGE